MFTKLNCDHHFVMYISQIIMLYTVNLYNAVCQLYLNKIGRKKKNIKYKCYSILPPPFFWRGNVMRWI